MYNTLNIPHTSNCLPSTHFLPILHNTPVLEYTTFTITKNFDINFIKDLISEGLPFTYTYNPQTNHHTFNITTYNLGQQHMLRYFVNEDYHFNWIDLEYTT
jgi:hypothetical protein